MRNRPGVILQMVCLFALLWILPIAVWKWITDRDYFNHVPNPTFKDVYGVKWELARKVKPYTFRHTSFLKTHERIRWLLGIDI